MPVGPLHPAKMLRHNPIMKCSETHLIPCAGIATVDCCKIVPCSYCLEFDPYGKPKVYGIATLNKATGVWSGIIAGALFEAWWERPYGQCDFVAALDGEEIYRASCDSYQTCRDSSDSAEVTIGYDSGTLRWEKIDPIPLPYVIGEDGCKTQFCGHCECACKCLCVTITLEDGTECKGEICDNSYDDKCDAPLWTGAIPCGYDDYALSVSLSRDAYGQCVIGGTASVSSISSDYSGFAGTHAPASWTSTPGTGSIDTSGAPASISLTSGNDNSATLSNTDFSKTIPTAGTVRFNWSYVTTDSSGDPDFDMFGYFTKDPNPLAGEVFVKLTPGISGGGTASQSGTVSISVPAGYKFGFRQQTFDNGQGPATTVVSSFSAPGAGPAPDVSSLDDTVVGDCQSLSASWQVGYTTIAVRCKVCDCNVEWPCCPNISPPPSALYLTLTTLSQVC